LIGNPADRRRLDLRLCRMAWELGLTVREYRALEAGETQLSVGGRG
jgi:hypothetical protein